MHAVPGKGPGKVPVHYFGTLEFAWLKPSEVCSFQTGLQAGMHICKAKSKNKPASFKKALHEVHVYFVVSNDSLSSSIGKICCDCTQLSAQHIAVKNATRQLAWLHQVVLVCRQADGDCHVFCFAK